MSPQTPPSPDSETDPPADDAHIVRLQKFLASTGLGSRRHCEDYIETGRVTVDGEIVTELGAKINPETQVISVDGERVRLQARRYYLLNKPSGFLCTNNDPAGRRRVVDLFPEEGQRLFTVGRLDENSEGLILVTNDGALAQRLAHPRYKVARTYHVQVVGNPTREKLEELRKGIRFKEGLFRVSGLKPLRKQGKSTFLELTLHEGQNREIRRMMARIGHKVIQLIRVRFGPLSIGKLKSGEYKRLSDWELKKLREMMNEIRSPDEAPPRKGRKTTAYGKGRPAQGAASKRRTPGRTPSDSNVMSGESDTRSKRARTTSGEGDTRSKRTRTTSGEGDIRSKRARSTSGEGDTRSKRTRTTSGEGDTRPKRARTTSGEGGSSSKRTRTTSAESNTGSKRARTTSGGSDTKPKKTRTTSGGSGTKPKKARTTSGGSGTKPKKTKTTSGGSGTRLNKTRTTTGESSTKSARSKKSYSTSGETSSRSKSSAAKSKKSGSTRGAVVSQQAASGRRMIGDDQKKSTRQGKQK
ncbi:MAG: pseudouridine synthase [Planctomycetota bacterium]